ncbi:hypothetical protein CY34DRAFT_17680 [Suillus luteus UH-Slu-Lm8-n1]|uniref:Uncharacterized protein n=1 Tax=Suillus luteus UH-Slu-Lm8-n1 TaxID=930992 RepID=A0A0C9ZAJ6_9AGAM|nr:hypothetical protein CY34DRAFT_17680 [Suillus luteus UH-Slu-Lm8-n1]
MLLDLGTTPQSPPPPLLSAIYEMSTALYFQEYRNLICNDLPGNMSPPSPVNPPHLFSKEAIRKSTCEDLQGHDPCCQDDVARFRPELRLPSPAGMQSHSHSPNSYYSHVSSQGHSHSSLSPRLQQHSYSPDSSPTATSINDISLSISQTTIQQPRPNGKMRTNAKQGNRRQHLSPAAKQMPPPAKAPRNTVKSTAIAFVKQDSVFLPGTTIGATHWIAYAMTKGRVCVISLSSGDRTLLQLPTVFAPSMSVIDMAVYGNRLVDVVITDDRATLVVQAVQSPSLPPPNLQPATLALPAHPPDIIFGPKPGKALLCTKLHAKQSDGSSKCITDGQNASRARAQGQEILLSKDHPSLAIGTL